MENNQRNSRKRLNSLILLVAFTAVMLIVSTYAWFSAQKNVTIGGLQGQVSVAEGLEISLDAKYWSQEINFKDYTNQWELKKVYGATSGTRKDGDDLSASPNHNIIPTELVPVSTTGLSAEQIKTALSLGTAPTTGDGIGEEDMNFYRGINQNGNELYEMITVKKYTGDGTGKGDVDATYSEFGETATTALTAATHDYPGYYAIDLFLRNSTKDVSKSALSGGVSGYDLWNELQLNSNSKLELLSSAATSTGLQNTVRVAFALYNMNEEQDSISGTDTWNDVLPTLDASAYMLATQEQVLAAYAGQTINDVAIWEPNSETHVQYVVDNNNSVKWNSTEQTKYGIPTATSGDDVKDKFGLTTPTPTYALSTQALTSALSAMTDLDSPANGLEKGDTNVVMVGSTATKGITDIYDWDDTPYEGLIKQVTLQTGAVDAANNNFTVGKIKQLVSVTSTPGNRYTLGDSDIETGAKEFKIPKGKVCKVRMYVWLEGQDVDTINHASHGGGVYLDIGLIKDATAES